MAQLNDVLTAISHPTRRAIITRLANGPARFLDIAEPFDVALNAITKHLKLLERAGLIERECDIALLPHHPNGERADDARGDRPAALER